MSRRGRPQRSRRRSCWPRPRSSDSWWPRSWSPVAALNLRVVTVGEVEACSPVGPVLQLPPTLVCDCSRVLKSGRDGHGGRAADWVLRCGRRFCRRPGTRARAGVHDAGSRGHLTTGDSDQEHLGTAVADGAWRPPRAGHRSVGSPSPRLLAASWAVGSPPGASPETHRGLPHASGGGGAVHRRARFPSAGTTSSPPPHPIRYMLTETGPMLPRSVSACSARSQVTIDTHRGIVGHIQTHSWCSDLAMEPGYKEVSTS
jgi:hypothetical protein